MGGKGRSWGLGRGVGRICFIRPYRVVVLARAVRKIIGLMSGTSADGVDAALVEVRGTGIDTKVGLLGFVFTPYPAGLRREILDLCDPDKGRVDRVCRMHGVMGEWFARGALDVCREAGVPVSEVDLIGSHGQTVHHLPDPAEAFGVRVRATLQIGDPSVIAERTGVTTVADFRTRDMAAGGQGAPLVPLVDYLLFRSDGAGRAMLNIGGIANVTLLPAGCGPDEVLAFDTGPGNMLVDALVDVFTSGARSYDADGALAASGQVSGALLEQLMQHPFLAMPPPKSTGREAFGRPLVDEVLAWRDRLSAPDLIRTATAFTARSVGEALGRFVFPLSRVEEVVVSGGGAENAVLMGMLQEVLGGRKVVRIETLGVPAEAKEAVAFAVLANETLAGHPGNLPRVTGASRPAVLGVVAPGGRCRIRVDPEGRFR